jgi:hypothetical protein
MYLLKTKNFLLNQRALLILAMAVVYFMVLPTHALAASVPPDQEACDKSQSGQYIGPQLVACKSGYNGGHALKNAAAICKNYVDTEHAACLDGFGKGACSINNPNQDALDKCLNSNPIIKDIRLIVNLLSAGVGVVITGSIIFAGIQYAYAGNNSTTVGAAKKRIQDSLIALLAFFFVYAFLNWIIPGPGLLFDL